MFHINNKIKYFENVLYNNMDKAIELSNKNTARNEQGYVVLKQDDKWRKDDEWDIVKDICKDSCCDLNNTGTMERPTTILQSLEESFKEVKLIREGKLSKKTWRQLREENSINNKEEK